MAYEDRVKAAVKPHSIMSEDRKKLYITGVEEVESFDENEIIMLTSGGNLVVRGSGLHMNGMSVDSGEVNVEGLITELCYEEVAPSGSLWTRLFH